MGISCTMSGGGAGDHRRRACRWRCMPSPMGATCRRPRRGASWRQLVAALPVGRADRHGDRALLGDGPRQPLGAGGAGLWRDGAGQGRGGGGRRRPRSPTAMRKGETDEFIAPTVIGGYAGAKDGDGFFCLNFRADRAREILAALGDPAFDGFDTGPRPTGRRCWGWSNTPTAHNAYMATGLSQAGARQHPGRMGGRARADPVPAGRDREIPACHLLPERRARGALSPAKTATCRSRPRSRPMTCNPK